MWIRDVHFYRNDVTGTGKTSFHIFNAFFVVVNGNDKLFIEKHLGKVAYSCTHFDNSPTEIFTELSVYPLSVINCSHHKLLVTDYEIQVINLMLYLLVLYVLSHLDFVTGNQSPGRGGQWYG